MNTYQYKVGFLIKGKCYYEIITTTDAARARELILTRYPGAVITSINRL